MDNIMKIAPVGDYINIDIDGDPVLIEEVTELRSQFGDGINAPIVGCLLIWNFKLYETLKKNHLMVECQYKHEHRFKKFTEVTLYDVEQVIADSYNESSVLFTAELKFDEISFQLKNLDDASLQNYSLGLFESLKQRLM